MPSTRNEQAPRIWPSFWSVFGGPAWIIAARGCLHHRTSESTPAAALAPAKVPDFGIEAQPPIADIGRSGCRQLSGHRFRASRPLITLLEPRCGDLIITSAPAPKRPCGDPILPGERQFRSDHRQLARCSPAPQNGRDTDAMIPTSCGPSSTLKSSAGANLDLPRQRRKSHGALKLLLPNFVGRDHPDQVYHRAWKDRGHLFDEAQLVAINVPQNRKRVNPLHQVDAPHEDGIKFDGS